MGATKTEGFSAQQNETAALAKALGHPARIAIVQHLASQQGCVCGQLVESLPLAQATVSQHLKELKQAGIVAGDVEGKNVCYCLNPAALEALAAELQSLAKLNRAQCKPGLCC